MNTSYSRAIFNNSIDYANSALPKLQIFKCNPRTNGGIKERIVSQFVDGQVNVLNISSNQGSKTREVTTLEGLKEKYGIVLDTCI